MALPPVSWVRVDGEAFTVPDLATLQRWVLEKRVLREDACSYDGSNWSPLGGRPELQLFFAASDRLESSSASAQHAILTMAHSAADDVFADAAPPAQELGWLTDARTEVLPERAVGPATISVATEYEALEAADAEDEDESAGVRHEMTFGGEPEVESDPASDPEVRGSAPSGTAGVRVGVPMQAARPAGDPPSVARPTVPVGDPPSLARPIPPAIPVAAPPLADVASMVVGDALYDAPDPVVAPRPVVDDRAGETGDGGTRPRLVAVRPGVPVTTVGSERLPTNPRPVAETAAPTSSPPRMHPVPVVNDDSNSPSAWIVVGIIAVVVTLFLLWATGYLGPTAGRPRTAVPEPTPAAAPPPVQPAEIIPVNQAPAAPGPVLAPVEPSPEPLPETKAPPAKTVDSKPADTKPADTKPADTKPADPKPADAAPKLTGRAAAQPGWDAVEKEDWAGARALFQEALAADPGNVRALYGRAYVSEKQGDISSATRDYCAAAKVEKNAEIVRELKAGLSRLGTTCP